MSLNLPEGESLRTGALWASGQMVQNSQTQLHRTSGRAESKDHRAQSPGAATGTALRGTHTTPGEPSEAADPRAACSVVTPDSGVQAALQPCHGNAARPSHTRSSSRKRTCVAQSQGGLGWPCLWEDTDPTVRAARCPQCLAWSWLRPTRSVCAHGWRQPLRPRSRWHSASLGSALMTGAWLQPLRPEPAHAWLLTALSALHRLRGSTGLSESSHRAQRPRSKPHGELRDSKGEPRGHHTRSRSGGENPEEHGKQGRGDCPSPRLLTHTGAMTRGGYV